MRKLKKSLRVVYFLFFMGLFVTQSVSAYVDPATTSYIIQIIAAFFITMGVFFTAFAAKVKLWFLKIKMKFFEESVRRSAKGNEVRKGEPPTGTLKSVFYEDRPLKSRILIAAVTSFGVVFTFAIYGVYDLFIGNNELFPYSFKDIWAQVAIYGILLFLVLTLILMCMRGKLFTIFISLAIGILLAGFLQGNFFNIGLGQLTGDTVPWHTYKKQAFINTALWLLIVITPLIISYFSKLLWKIVCITLPSFLVVVQMVSLFLSISTTNAFAPKSQGFLSESGIYEMSAKENIVVFVLDRLDQEYVDALISENPDYFKDLDGFTQYTNNLSYYCRTYPSVVNLFTGKYYRYDVPADDFVNDAYKNSTFFKDLKKQGFQIKLYMESPHTYTNINQLDGLADNISYEKAKVDFNSFYKNFLYLSAFKNGPHVIKPTFWTSTNKLTKAVKAKKGSDIYLTDDKKFYNNMKEKKITAQSDQKNFIYYHLNGAHTPHTLNENVEEVESDQTDSRIQTKASFTIIREAIKQMKEQGIYENSTIIITGDHAKSEDNNKLNKPKKTALFVKQKDHANTSLKYSTAPVNTDNFRATVIKAAGMKTDNYGFTYTEVPLNSKIPRKYFYRYQPENYTEDWLEEFEVIGDASNFKNWHKIKEYKVEHPFA